MSVVLQPERGEIRVTDHIHLHDPVSSVEFTLNDGLTPYAEHGMLERIATSADGLRATYRVSMQTPRNDLKLQYHGQPGFSGRRAHGGMPQGIVTEQGVYLDGSSAWYPLIDASFAAVRMSVTLPDGWQSVSIGRRTVVDGKVTWTSDKPHDDLYLIAGPFIRHSVRHDDIDLSVYLLDDDPALAQRYLDVMSGYLDHYSKLIGDYPYGKFAVVENPWQTGYGMPSFTLLGSRVMRLPFILYTSLPHEILHNWWGNGVWIDYEKGNWSEGLTAYLADHWMQASRGKGAEYRLKALQRYSNFAARGADSPLIDFVSRHGDASQSIGYSKSLMLFHMLRNALGDDAFRAGLRRLWHDHAFERVGFAQVIRALSGDRHVLADRFTTWLTATGAPHIALGDVAVQPAGEGWEMTLTIEQRQDSAFAVDLPVVVTLQGHEMAERRLVRIDRPQQRISLSFETRPLRIDIDPEYDVLRYLDPTEQPPALNRLFGGTQTWLVVPTAADPTTHAAWKALADVWSRRYPGLRRIDDTSADALDPTADRLILGWDNLALPGASKALSRHHQTIDGEALRLAGECHRRGKITVVLVGSDAQGASTGFIGADSVAAIHQMARKLPHYGSYGRLLFDQDGKNLRKDTLTSEHSTLSRQLGTEAIELHLTPRPAL